MMFNVFFMWIYVLSRNIRDRDGNKCSHSVMFFSPLDRNVFIPNKSNQEESDEEEEDE